MAQRAVEAASAPGIDAETEEIASKSERIMRPSMAVSMFRGRRHISANVDPSNVAADVGEDEAETLVFQPLVAAPFVPPEEIQEAVGPDPLMVFKADVLRALRGAEGNTMSTAELSAQVQNPAPDTPFTQHLQELLVDRQLAKWVVENESLQLVNE